MLSFMLFYIGSIYKKYKEIKIKIKPVSDLFQLEVQERKECGFLAALVLKFISIALAMLF